ncbi:LysR substrate-binding domain-containing protein [Orrella sp. 11846]|uniref:LysR substrate-binding domain-containing protein n=1 Tax=Orrella sp. 11846 TaxID=3409913 RepID=UPI003B59B1D1
MHFELSDLRVFVAVAQSPSLTQGAKQAHLSVAATSARIKALEAQLNSKLLYRGSRGSTLTPDGQLLLKHARLILRQVDYAKNEFSERSGRLVGHIRIFSNTTSMTEFLPEVLAQFLAQHPEVSVDLQERLSRDIILGVTEGAADMGLIAGPVGAEDLNVIHYSTDRLILAVPKEHPIAIQYQNQQQNQSKQIESTQKTLAHEIDINTYARNGVTLLRSLAYPHIGLREGSTLYDLMNRQVNRLGKVLPLRVQTSSYEGICRMIEAGVGVGVVPESAALRYQNTMHFDIIPLRETWALRERSILVRDLEAMPECVKELIKVISVAGLQAEKHAQT